jgi:hypothetical protein
MIRKSNMLDNILIVIDSAAFGYNFDKIYKMQNLFNIVIAMPESFEWLLLRIRYSSDKVINLKLTRTYNYADSEKYLTWEKYYTELIQVIDLNYLKGLEVDTEYLTNSCINNLLKIFDFVDLQKLISNKNSDDNTNQTHHYKEV